MKHSLYLLACLLISQSTHTLASCWEKPLISKAPTAFILAMGANVGELKKANTDAQAFADAIQKRFNIPSPNKCVLKNVTRGDFKSALKRLQKLVRKPDQVFIYFSGHGTQVPDNNNDEGCYDEAFVIFSDIGSKPYRIRDDFLVAQVNKIGSNRITTIIDTCFSGGMLRGSHNCLDMKSKLWFADDDESDILPKNDCPSTDIKLLKGTVYTASEVLKGTVYTASKEYQLAWEFDKGGVFTTFFIENMRKNSKTKLKKIFDMTAKQVSRKTGQRDCEQLQEPQRQP